MWLNAAENHLGRVKWFSECTKHTLCIASYHCFPSIICGPGLDWLAVWSGFGPDCGLWESLKCSIAQRISSLWCVERFLPSNTLIRPLTLFHRPFQCVCLVRIYQILLQVYHMERPLCFSSLVQFNQTPSQSLYQTLPTHSITYTVHVNRKQFYRCTDLPNMLKSPESQTKPT